MQTKFVVLIAFALLGIALAQTAADKIASLPNVVGPIGNQYSGYVNVNATGGRFLHYWFVENADPAAPVVLWLNGGPGCSSMDGFLYEMGPWNWGEGTNNVTLVPNPWTWTKNAHMLFLESPAGVGFSYATNTYLPSDTQTADDAFNFLVSFFKSAPKYANNPFYISGESFAGIYVPTLANRVLVGNKAGQSKINLQGVLVGNGVTDPEASDDMNNLFPFAYGHALYPTSIWNQIQAACGSGSSADAASCDDLTNYVYSIFDNLDIYNIYAECYQQRPNVHRRTHKIQKRAMMTPPCTDAHKADIWLNQAGVKSAIHVRSDITWTICSESINMVYNHNIPSMIPIYKNLIANSVRVLIFSGDVDASVPYTGTEYWTSRFGAPIVGRDWQPWTVNGQIAGYVTEYKGFTYATVRGSGHMVPQYTPVEAYYMFTRFLKNQPL